MTEACFLQLSPIPFSWIWVQTPGTAAPGGLIPEEMLPLAVGENVSGGQNPWKHDGLLVRYETLSANSSSRNGAVSGKHLCTGKTKTCPLEEVTVWAQEERNWHQKPKTAGRGGSAVVSLKTENKGAEMPSHGWLIPLYFMYSVIYYCKWIIVIIICRLGSCFV